MDNLEYNVLLKKLYNNEEINKLIKEYNLSDQEIKKNLVTHTLLFVRGGARTHLLCVLLKSCFQTK